MKTVRAIVTRQEGMDGGAILAAVLVVVFLPNRTMDPWGIVNPHMLGSTVAVLMGFSLSGYWAARLLGAQFGLLAAGFASGFVSSTMGIAAMGARASSTVGHSRAAAAGATASILGSLIYLIVLVAAVDAAIVQLMIIPLSGAVAACLAYTIILAWTTNTASRPGDDVSSRAYNFKAIALFVMLVVVFGLVSTISVSRFGEGGVLLSAAMTAILDAHATAVSIATMVRNGKIDEAGGTFAIMIGLSVNMAIKIPAAFALGPRPFAVRVSAGLILVLIGLWSGFAIKSAVQP